MGTNWAPTEFKDGFASGSPKYAVLVQSLRGAIRSGELPAGARLPPVRELAWKLGITPGTVARAYRMAVEEGLLEAAVGRGTFVAGEAERRPEPDKPLLNLEQPDMADFRGCHVPDVGQGAVIRDIMAQLARDPAHDYVDYPNHVTDLPARQAVCDWIGDDRAGRVVPDDVVLGFGAQNSAMMCLQACLTGLTPVIMTEQLAYPGVRHAARLLRAKIVGVEMDDQGIRPDSLEAAYRTHGGQVLMTSAEVHSPTTVRTTLERRRQIAEVARRYQFHIIEDDCHRVALSPVPSYRALCPEQAWYVSSITKCVSGALRFGFAICPASHAQMARQVAQSSFYGISQPIADLSARLIRSGAAEEIRARVEASIAERVRLAVNEMGSWDIAWRPDAPFLWMKLPTGWRGSTFGMACEGAKIRVKPADEFALPDGAAPHAVRLALNADMPEARFRAALATMSDFLQRPPAGVDI
ncbi:GntR family transcriptional regulator [Brevirhabdus pacifica]|uniref:GntR family transcriptional regulator n=1 Tax=Brevirhabdus pacifica TaxID=1267768 RepID=A0A1U7DF33_9RHOB|nr:GntR family transcriptional regulator [Brevirhabdus pacifica]PJJ86957.1 DNA-binding transcriptional MocR family regulator [Brevirhabdus pacifica]